MVYTAVKVDAAARIVDPIFAHVNSLKAAADSQRRKGEALPLPAYGVFLKDYFETEW